MAGFSINTVAISGNLTRDPELRSLPSGMSVCEIGVAVNERVKNQHTGEYEDRPNFFDVTIWGGVGEWVARTLTKGSAVAVAGRLRWESWDDRTTGQKRSKVKIVAEAITAQSPGGAVRQQEPIPQSDVSSDPSGFEPREPQPVQPTAYGSFDSGATPGADDDIPFVSLFTADPERTVAEWDNLKGTRRA